ncbi:MAG: hypothetical protein IT290_10065 [Deltaproteobacteria bacterium]|nr:hypothetical protein [Deltaproteobacteria bacterium]
MMTPSEEVAFEAEVRAIARGELGDATVAAMYRVAATLRTDSRKHEMCVWLAVHGSSAVIRCAALDMLEEILVVARGEREGFEPHHRRPVMLMPVINALVTAERSSCASTSLRASELLEPERRYGIPALGDDPCVQIREELDRTLSDASLSAAQRARQVAQLMAAGLAAEGM